MAHRKGSPAEWRVRPDLRFTWKPDARCPTYMGFNRPKFCSVVGSRNVLFVGDSTQLALHDVFLNHLANMKTAKEMGDPGDAW